MPAIHRSYIVLGVIALVSGLTLTATRVGAENPGPDSSAPAATSSEDARLRALVSAEVERQVAQRTAGLEQRVKAIENLIAASRTRTPRDVIESMTTTLRSQIQLYALQHQDRLPTLAELQNDWMILRVKDAKDVGPYLSAAPINPLMKSSKVVAPNTPTNGAGWVYNEADGRLYPVVPAGTKMPQAVTDNR